MSPLGWHGRQARFQTVGQSNLFLKRAARCLNLHQKTDLLRVFVLVELQVPEQFELVLG